MAVAGVAADARAFQRARLVEHDAERHVKGPAALGREVVVQLLDARFVADGGERVGRARLRLGRVGAALAVDAIQPLGLRVVRLEIVVRDRPRGRDAAGMAQLAEVLAPQPEQRRAVELGVAADVVVGVRMERGAAAVEPLLPGLVAAEDVHGARAPVVLLAPHVVAALDDENAFARGREAVGERAAARAAADHDHVVAAVCPGSAHSLLPRAVSASVGRQA